MLSPAHSLLDSIAPLAAFPTTESLATRYIPLALLAVLLVASLIKAIRVWGEIHDVEEPATVSDLLASFQEAHALGELDDEEFARVTEKLAASSGKAGLADFLARPHAPTHGGPDQLVPPAASQGASPSSPQDSGGTIPS
jgi:hypothetical protein